MTFRGCMNNTRKQYHKKEKKRKKREKRKEKRTFKGQYASMLKILNKFTNQP